MTDCASCTGTKIEINKKRDKTIRITLAGPGDLTDAKIWFSVKDDTDEPDTEAYITKKSANNGGSDAQAKVVEAYIQDNDPNSPTYKQMVGIIEIYLVPDDTQDMEVGDYLYDVVIETNIPRRLQAVRPSTFTVLQPVTNT